MRKYIGLIIVILTVVLNISCEYITDLEIEAGLTDGLVAYWPIIGSDGLNAIKDYSGNNNHATSFITVTSMVFDTGKYNTALKNNGSGFSCTKNGAFPTSSGFTFTTWYKNLGIGGGLTTTMLHMIYNGTQRFYIRCNPDTGYFYISAAGSTTLTFSSSNLDNWSYITVTYDKNNLNLYINSECVATTVVTTKKDVDVANDIRVLHYNSDDILSGYLDEIRIYNRALSEAEIKKLMTVGVE